VRGAKRPNPIFTAKSSFFNSRPSKNSPDLVGNFYDWARFDFNPNVLQNNYVLAAIILKLTAKLRRFISAPEPHLIPSKVG
jgi:hypothetical protein